MYIIYSVYSNRYNRKDNSLIEFLLGFIFGAFISGLIVYVLMVEKYK